MITLVLAALLTGTPCANPAIMSAGVQSVTTNGQLKHYTIAITVENLGGVRQPSNLLQSVIVFQDGQKVGQMGLQPLRPKQSQKVTYSFDRAAEAGEGSTDFTFRLDFDGRSGNKVSCHKGNETFAIIV